MSDKINMSLITVVETNAYLAQAKSILTDSERMDVVNMIAMDPTCGNVMQGTGGVRKVRIPLAGQGKSGGARVVYFAYDEDHPVFLFAVFAKNQKSNLTKAQRNELKKVTTEITKAWRKTQ